MSPFCIACLELLASTIRAVNEEGIPGPFVANLNCATNALARVVWHVSTGSSEIELWLLPNGLLPLGERQESILALIVCPFVSSVEPTVSKTIVRVPISAATGGAAQTWANQTLADLLVEEEPCDW